MRRPEPKSARAIGSAFDAARCWQGTRDAFDEIDSLDK